MSYNDSRLEFETAAGIRVPKRTIHRFAQMIAPPLLEADKTADDLGIVPGDSTEVRALESREMNNVHIFLSDGESCFT